MTWPWGAVMADVQTALTTAGVTAPWFEGYEFATANHAPPRFVWYPTVTEAEAAFRGGETIDPASLATGQERIEVRCWDNSHDAAWNLRTAFLRAIMNTALADVRWRGDVWLHADASSGVMFRGRVVVVQLQLAVPVPETTPTAPTITGINQKSTLVHSSGDQTGCQNP
jgi:hypothetical protein